MFVENGHDATELGQCPHAPGTPEWKTWQHQFMNQQSCERDDWNFHRTPNRATDAYERADARMAAVKEQVLAARTEANDWHDSVMAEIEEPAPKRITDGPIFAGGRWSKDDLIGQVMKGATFRLFRLDDNNQPYPDPYWTGVGNITTTVSGSGYTVGGFGLLRDSALNATHSFTLFKEQWIGLTDPWGSSAHWCTGDPIASGRAHRRTRGQTIEERRLCQALSGKPVTVRPSSQNHAWKRKR